MARDQYEYDVGGELKDRYGRSQYMVLPKHATPLSTDTIRAYEPADVDGRPQIVLQDALGNDITSSFVSIGSKTSPILFADSYGAKGDGATADSAAVQAAVNAISAAAVAAGTQGMLMFTPGKTYKLGGITPKSNVTLWCYGARIMLDTSATFGIFTSGSVATPVSNWHLRGGTFIGTNTETDNQLVFGVRQGTDVSVRDIYVSNWFTGPIYFKDCIRAAVLYNTLINTTHNPGGTNAINLGIGSTDNVAWNSMWCVGNYIDGVQAEGIAVGETGSSASNKLYVHIAENTVISAGNTCINIEWSTAATGEASRLNVVNNHCTLAGGGTSSAASGIAAVVSPASNNDPSLVNRIVIANNTVESNQRGITCNASDAIVVGNHVTAGFFALSAGGSGTFTGATGSTGGIPSTTLTVTNEPVGVVNGSPITGAGISGGTYIVSGAGSGTYTLSQSATVTAGTAITMYSQTFRNTVANNIFKVGANPSSLLVNLNGLRDSKIHNNQFICDPGSAAATSHGIGGTRCGWVDITDNLISYAPGNGIQWTGGNNDFVIARNRIYNPSEGGSVDGIAISAISGTLAQVIDNQIIDDRAAHKMVNGVSIGAGATGKVELVGNEIRGAVTSPASGVTNFALIKNNITDAPAWPAATSAPAAPASGTPTTALPYPVVYYVTGGTVTHISLQRVGSSSRDMSTTGPVTAVLAPGDTMTLTYTVAPTLMLEPLQL